MAKISVHQVSRGFLIYVPEEQMKQLRDNLISQPGLPTTPAAQRTPLETLAIKVTKAVDTYEDSIRRSTNS